MIEDKRVTLPYITKLEYDILKLLETEDGCTWKNFLKEIIISESSLSNNLVQLIEKKYIEKISDKRPYQYCITPEGREYRSQIEQILVRDVIFPSNELNLNTDGKIIYALQENPILFISDLVNQKLGINRSTLYRHLSTLVERKIIEKVVVPGVSKLGYKITFLGRRKYKENSLYLL